MIYIYILYIYIYYDLYIYINYPLYSGYNKIIDCIYTPNMISWWLGQPGNIFVQVMGKSPDEDLSSCHGAALARDVAPIGASAGSIGSMNNLGETNI